MTRGIFFIFISLIPLLYVYGDNITPPSGCKNPQLHCVEPGQTRTIQGVPVYQSCWKYNVIYDCPHWASTTNSCKQSINCVPNGEPIIVNPWEKQLNMTCTNTTVSYTCEKYKTTPHCKPAISYTQGNDQFSTQPTDTFNNAMAAMGTLDALQKAVTANPVEVFKGAGAICKEPNHLGPFTTNCCDRQLHTHGTHWSINQCKKGDIKLATARRGKRTHFIGKWCAHHLPPPFSHTCTEHRQGFCTFHSMLGRLIQEQGRAQINAIARNANRDTVRQQGKWPYTSSHAQWNTITLNGIKIASFTAQSLNQSTIPNAKSYADPLTVLSGKHELFAVCTMGHDCGVLPSNPHAFIDQTVNGWQIISAPKHVLNKTFITSHISVQGSCQNNRCEWTLSSIGPSGIHTQLQSTVSWNLFSAPLINEQVQPGFMQTALSTPMNITLKPYLYAPDTNVSTGYALQYKLPNSQQWQTYPNLIPLQIPKESAITLSKNPLVQLVGQCDPVTGNCHAIVTAQIQVTAMPWGSAHHPKCEGFTPDQLMLLDFSTMDLSSWSQQFSHKSGPSQEQLSKRATASAATFNQAMQDNGTVNSPNPNHDKSVIFSVTPSEGQGPFDVTLTATAYWPNYIPYGQCGYPATGTQHRSVSSLNINWGDGTQQTLLASQTKTFTQAGVSEENGERCTYQIPAFETTHHYNKPLGKNITEQIKGTFTTLKSTHTALFKIINYWDTPPIRNQEGGGASDTSDNRVHPNQQPGSGPYNPNQIPGDPTNTTGPEY